MAAWQRSLKRTCEDCKRPFEATYGTAQEYCSNACKQRAYRKRKKAERLSQSADPKKSVTSIWSGT